LCPAKCAFLPPTRLKYGLAAPFFLFLPLLVLLLRFGGVFTVFGSLRKSALFLLLSLPFVTYLPTSGRPSLRARLFTFFFFFLWITPTTLTPFIDRGVPSWAPFSNPLLVSLYGYTSVVVLSFLSLEFYIGYTDFGGGRS